MKTKQTTNNIFDIQVSRNSEKVNKLSRNRIPWHLRTIGNVEKWMLKNIYNLDPTSERIIRFYTYNDEQGEDFDFKCPNYTYDLTSCLYDDFCETCNTVGKYIQEHFGVTGRYFYDVKVGLEYERIGSPVMGYEWNMNFDWEILDTDNPRCVLGNPSKRRDCYYLSNFNSKLTIDGYTLSGNYRKFSDVLSDLVSKTIIVHSKSDAKAILRIMKFLGVSSVQIGNKEHYNNPEIRGFFSRNTFGYQLDRIEDQTVICAIPKRHLPVDTEFILDIDEFIVKRSLKARLRDGRYTRARRHRKGTTN